MNTEKDRFIQQAAIAFIPTGFTNETIIDVAEKLADDLKERGHFADQPAEPCGICKADADELVRWLKEKYRDAEDGRPHNNSNAANYWNGVRDGYKMVLEYLGEQP